MRSIPHSANDPLPPPYDQPLPDDHPGYDDDDGVPHAVCAMPCDNLATHIVTTATGRRLSLCAEHASIHRRVMPIGVALAEMWCPGCDASLVDGERRLCHLDEVPV